MVNKTHGHETCKQCKDPIKQAFVWKEKEKKKENEKENVSLTGSDRWHVKMAHENLNLYMLGKDTKTNITQILITLKSDPS